MKMNIREARKVIAKHMREENKKKDVTLKIKCEKLVGTHWKTHNSYSSPDDGWILYLKVIGVSDSGNAKVLSIQKTSHNKVEINEETRVVYDDGNMGGYTKITEKEWNKGVKPSLNRIIREYEL